MADGGQDFNLGHVVGSAGEKGDDGSTVWSTSTAPTYANSKYTFTISNLSGKTGLEIAVNDIIFYSTYYYIVSVVGSTTVDCNTRVNIKGSDASVTIVDNLTSTSSTSALSAKQGKVLNDNKVETSAIATSWGGTTSDSKVPSEKLAKTSLDAKQPTLVSGTNIKTINNNSILGSGNLEIQSSSVDIATSWGSTLSDTKVPSEKLTKNSLDAKADASSLATVATSGDYDDLTDKPTIPSKISDLTNDSDFIEKSNTSGLIKNDGTIDTTSYSTFSGSYNDLSNKPTIPSKISDLTNDSDFIETSSTAGLIKNDGSIDTSTYLTSSALSNYVQKSNTSGLLKNDGTVDTNHYIPISDIADDLATNNNQKVLSAKQGYLLNQNKLGIIQSNYKGKNVVVDSSTGWITFEDKPTIPTKVSDLTNDSGFITSSSLPTKTSDLTNDGDGTNAFLTQHQSLTNYIQKSSTSGLVKNDGTIDTSAYITSSALSNYMQKSSTSGLMKNDGTVDTTSYSTFSGSYSDLSNKPSIPSSSSDLSDGSDLVKTSSTAGLLKNDGTVDSTSYQTALVSGTNIKTINNESLLGSGNITISGGGGSLSNLSGGLLVYDSTDSVVEYDGNELATVNDIPTNFIPTSDIVDDLTTGGATKVLSAKQGKILDSTKLDKSQTSYKGKNVVVHSSTGLITFEDKPTIPSKVSDLTNDSGFITSSAISGMLTSSDIADNLTTNDATKVLSAKQGKALKDLIGDAITYINQ